MSLAASGMRPQQLAACSSGRRSSTHSGGARAAQSLVVPLAYKRNSQRQPGFIDLDRLPPLDPSDVPPPPPPPPQQPQQQQQQQAPQQAAAAPPPPQQQAPAGGSGYTTDNGGGGYIDGYLDDFAPLPPLPQAPGGGSGYQQQRGGGGGYGSGYGNGGGYGYGGGYGNGGGRRQQQQQQQQSGYQSFADPAFWPPPLPNQGGAGGYGYGGRNGGAGRNGTGAYRGFTGFDDATDLQLLQDLDAYGGLYPNDRWLEEVEVVVEEDLSPKYVNGKRVLVNSEITAPQVRVQDASKAEVGVMSFEAARSMAAESGADVVLMNESAEPPVVRLIQFSKYKFELERAAKQKQKSSKSTEVKEVRLRPVTEPHDYEVKVKAAKGFLAKGSRVKLTMQFSGREMRFKEQGKEMMLKLIEELSGVSKMDSPLSLRPSTFSATLSPLNK